MKKNLFLVYRFETPINPHIPPQPLTACSVASLMLFVSFIALIVDPPMGVSVLVWLDECTS